MTQTEIEAYDRGFEAALRALKQIEVRELMQAADATAHQFVRLELRNRSMRRAMNFGWLVAGALAVALVALWVTR